MNDPTTFEPVASDATASKGHATETPKSSQRVQRVRELLSDPWIFTGMWVALCLAVPVIFYGLGQATGVLGALYDGGVIGGTAMIAGGLAAPFAVGVAWVVARRRAGFRFSHWLHYGVLFLASLGAFFYGFMVFAFGGYALTLGHGELLTQMPLTGWEFIVAGGLAVGGLTAGVALFRDDVGEETFRLLGIWLVCAVGLHVFLADPNFHLFIGLAWGSGGAMLLVFAAARPLYNRDPVTRDWGARVRYYLGSLLFTYGTLFLFLLAEGGMIAIGEGSPSANWPTGGGLF